MSHRPKRWDLLRRLVRALRSPGDTLGQRVVHGGLWTAVSKVATRGVGFARTVVLARLLAPEDFGLFGIALLTQATLDTLLEVGVDQALIQRERGTERFLDAAWTLKLVKATLVAAGLVVTAPYVANFFGEPKAVALIQVLSAVVVIQGLENVGAVYFRRDLEFRKQFALDFGNTAFNALVAIPAALLLGSVWALMAGVVAGSLVRLALTFGLHPYRPRLEFQWNRIKEILHFGKWIFGSSTLVYAATQGDDILLGRWLGAPALGLYRVAYQISNAVATEVTHVISAVTLPAYSKLQSETRRLTEAFLSTLTMTAALVVPLTAAVLIFTADFVHLFLGEQWAGAIGPVRILALAGLLRALSACWGPLYLARGRTNKEFWKQLVRTVLTLGPAYPLTMAYGIDGMSLSVLAGIGGALALDGWWTRTWHEVRVGLRNVERALRAPAVSALAAVVPVLALYPTAKATVLEFAGLTLLFGGSYATVLVVLERLGQGTAIRRMVALLERV